MSSLFVLSLLAFGLAMVFAQVVGGWRDSFAKAWHAGAVRPGGEQVEGVTMVVPARDAAETIAPLLQDLHAQQWPKELVEVLVVDDGSSDATSGIVRGMLRNWPGLQLLPATGAGKKAAITQGVAAARWPFVLLTDADARCGPRRVACAMHAMRAQQAQLLLMPVATCAEGGAVQRVQADEQAALLGVAAGTALQGGAVLANGANMAFSKAAFLAVGGYTGDAWAGGDDLFLLHRMHRAGRKVAFLADPEAVVTVQAEPTVAGFWRQRLRWAGKMRGVGGSGRWIALGGLLLPWFLAVITCFITPQRLMEQRPFTVLLLLAAAWVLWAWPVLGLVAEVRRFLRKAPHACAVEGRGSGTLFSLLAFSMYAPVVAMASLVVRPLWKGRRV